MDISFIRGVVPPIVTPVDAEERVDEEGLRRVVDHVIAGGVHGLLVLGTNGEFFGLSEEEQRRAVRIAVDRAEGRIPVYMGIGGITTKSCIQSARMAEELKVQAITVLPPMFLKLTEDEMYGHFEAIAKSTELPVLLYNSPERVGNNISAASLERLADIPNIAGIKDSSGDFALTAEYIRRTRGKGFRVMAGRDVMILASLVYGAVGCVASTANIVPKLVVEIYENFAAGDLQGALEAQYKLNPLRLAYNLGSFPVVSKDAMNLLGLQVGKPIRPLAGCTEQNLEKLKRIMEESGAFERL
jgi:4-hydroxy-tetrahydrodipicolinate synthase